MPGDNLSFSGGKLLSQRLLLFPKDFVNTDAVMPTETSRPTADLSAQSISGESDHELWKKELQLNIKKCPKYIKCICSLMHGHILDLFSSEYDSGLQTASLLPGNICQVNLASSSGTMTFNLRC